MTFFNNKINGSQYLQIIKKIPTNLSKQFILKNFGMMVGDKSFYKMLICFELLKETKKIKGDIVEFGVWNGNNLLTLKKIIDFLNIRKKVIGYDNFIGFQDQKNIIGKHAGNLKLLKFIIKFFKLKNIKIIKDDILKLKKYQKNFKKLSFIYIDCDYYDATKIILDKLSKKLSIGGIIVFDEGIIGQKTEEPKALRDFLKHNRSFYKKILLKKNYQPDVYLKKIR